MAGSTAPALLLLALASSAGLLPATGSAEIEVDVILPDRLEAHPSELFRINLLALRDPHIFIEVEPIPGFPICVDATDPLTPAVPSIEGPCFATHPAPLSLAIEALPFNLEAATISASWTAVDTGVLGPGLLRGFLSQEDAEAIIFPDEIEVIGGQTLASLLAGGPGNCATESDLDQFGGVDGWWFNFEIEATRPAAGD